MPRFCPHSEKVAFLALGEIKNAEVGRSKNNHL